MAGLEALETDPLVRLCSLVEQKLGKPFRGFFVAAGSELAREDIADLTVTPR